MGSLDVTSIPVKANCILVMEQGKIIEMGCHAELIEKDGPYKKTYRMQFSQQGS